MAHWTEQSDVAQLKLRILSDGHGLTSRQITRDLAEMLASDIEDALLEWTHGLRSRQIHTIALCTIERRLRTMLTVD
jgi:hypothetical protein